MGMLEDLNDKNVKLNDDEKKLILEYEKKLELEVTQSTKQTIGEANEFYQNRILPAIIKRFKKDAEKDSSEKPYRLICTVGNSPEPIIFTIFRQSPQYLELLFTKDTEGQCDDIIEKIEFDRTKINKTQIEKDDPDNIYLAIKDICSSSDNERVAIDITGGTKIMSAAGALAGYIKKIDVTYITNYVYSTHYRKPIPFSETFMRLNNPIETFGAVDERIAEENFNKGHYITAREIYRKLLEEKIADGDLEKKWKTRTLLSGAYSCLMNLNFREAIIDIDKSIMNIKNGKKSDKELYEKLNSLEIFRKRIEPIARLGNLAEISNIFSEMETFVAVIYNVAIIYKTQKNYNIALLLFYRIIELLSQYELYLKYEIDTEKADYKKLLETFENEQAIIDKINKIRAQFKLPDKCKLPDKISLLDGWEILAVSPISFLAPKPCEEKIKILERINTKIKLRNKGIFAHGYILTNEKECDGFNDLVDASIHFSESLDIKKAIEETKFTNFNRR